jgi:hypothetical protein
MVRSTVAINRNYSFDFSVQQTAVSPVRRVKIAGSWLSTTPVFFAYWRFAAERQNIFFGRLKSEGATTYQTSDPILLRYKFTNAYRASDRVSQYLIRNVIYRNDLPASPAEVFFRTMLFKMFNRIETWEYLEQELGRITLHTYRFDRVDKALTRRLKQGGRVYSAAYIMPSATKAFGHQAKHQNHLRLLEHLIARDFPAKLGDCASMGQAFSLLLSAPSVGPFLAYQYATDLNYSSCTDFREDEFVMAGPGALDGISKCFSDTSEASPEDIIRYMYEHQDVHFAEQGIKFADLWGRPLQLIDCQNVFCEISKYARVAFPEYQGSAGRTRIKQKFMPRGSLPTPWYPPKWGLNEKIASTSAKANRQQ